MSLPTRDIAIACASVLAFGIGLLAALVAIGLVIGLVTGVWV